ncbi:MAG: hypothetical protein O6913_10840, partial [Chloroflexi bacterium]|nr:hypothetical protein [Chloroflexota bacterium]
MNQRRDETPWGLILGMAVLIAFGAPGLVQTDDCTSVPTATRQDVVDPVRPPISRVRGDRGCAQLGDNIGHEPARIEAAERIL